MYYPYTAAKKYRPMSKLSNGPICQTFLLRTLVTHLQAYRSFSVKSRSFFPLEQDLSKSVIKIFLGAAMAKKNKKIWTYGNYFQIQIKAFICCPALCQATAQTHSYSPSKAGSIEECYWQTIWRSNNTWVRPLRTPSKECEGNENQCSAGE